MLIWVTPFTLIRISSKLCSTNKTGHVLILARALVPDAVHEDGLAVEASHDQALDQAASKSLFLEGCFAIRILLLRELTSTFDATSRDVKKNLARPPGYRRARQAGVAQ